MNVLWTGLSTESTTESRRKTLRIHHNSRIAKYRSPFGAVPCGTDVAIRVAVTEADPAHVQVTLRTWVDGEGEKLLPMDHVGGGAFHVMLPCPEPDLVWYSFRVRDQDGAERWYGAREGRTGGEGALYDHADVPSFQLTVYLPRETRPDWYERGMVYQIFPDRYRRDDAWRERTGAALAVPRGGIPRKLVEDWGTPASYVREDDGSVAHWDFYGGSLKGIEQDLPRLAEMGITALYLNPVFEAASNHRYDTGDYLKIDAALGTEADFRSLCASAGELGISIILDGVFNHTGDDSVYFNRYGHYPEPGAWQALKEGAASRWADAYHLHPDGTYDAWWGVGNMPALNEDSRSVRDLLLAEDGVIRRWLRAGARGWRLDVADELSDGLLADIKTAALAERPDALVLGEVWEDASNKVSYGKLRRYLLGSELDSAMNYPFRDMVIGFLTGGTDAHDAAEVIESLRENYPPEALRCALNLLGSHDKPRILTVLGDMPDESTLTEAQRAAWKLPDNRIGLAKSRFWLATLMQMTFPGVPSIYYGDEAGMQGLSDPCNRGPFPWGDEDGDTLIMIKNAAGLRRALPFLADGAIEARAINDDLLAFTRRGAGGQALTVLVNRSLGTTHTARIPMLGEAAVDVISGADVAADANDTASVRLYPLGSAAVYFHPRQRLQKRLEGGAGVVCHITSVPNGGHPGTLGEPARRFIDHLAAMGMRYWQVLPVNPTDAWHSPYAGPSAFAGNIDLLDIDRGQLFLEFQELEHEGAPTWDPAYALFRARNDSWLKPFAAYMAVKDAHRGSSRHDWEPELSGYDGKILEDPRYSELARFHMYGQWRFEVAWHELLDYAHAHGIDIIGDIPMYVSDDSADAWCAPELFNLDSEGRATQIGGAPPDAFAPEGQKWGNPTYRWDRMRRDGYTWWVQRLKRSISLYDRVRLDNFLSFQSFFSIPAEGGAADGRWLPGPGIELFERAHDELGPLPLIAEDLGYLTPAVRTLTAGTGFPGMDVLQFADYDVRDGIHPHADKIMYTSTHDTATLVGWCERSFCSPGDADGARNMSRDIMRRALASDAVVVMMTLQDVLGLGDDARMNVPGTAAGNWTWKADEEDVAGAVERTALLLHETGRSA